MSRSKRAPYWTEGYGSPTKKIRKRMANKAVRRVKPSELGTATAEFKKRYNSWDICDFKFLDKKNPKVRRK